ncbi:MAG: glycosyltransferase family 4 protein [Elusimicrobia bacterium HGW-Elusimicrobia-3]|jgi:glycosyltransferase involved in cell wall biosynthesis|nr:MAG: glycosyltransferase family 4 protein [Elusimicrobia bacterium HGW-Elusimicrobia-3]
MSKILYLANAGDIHTARWVNAIAKKGNSVTLLTVQPMERCVPVDPAVRVRQLYWHGGAGYYLNVPEVRRWIKEIQPDLMHAHYATGYGTLARLVGFHPTITSAWGSDILVFPKKSIFHRALLVNNLKYADYIASTSRVMAEEMTQLISPCNPIALTPFGVDCGCFSPKPEKSDADIIIGTVKKLERIYGIDFLIDAFALVKRGYQGGRKLKLKIYGKGPLEGQLRKLAIKRGVMEDTDFCGYVRHEDLPSVFNSFSVSVALSRSESFGVSVLEASACGVPVVVSDVGGLPEVVLNGKTGFIVGAGKVDEAATAILNILHKPEMAAQMGESGRRHVLQYYSWEDSVNKMLSLYDMVVRNNSSVQKRA